MRKVIEALIDEDSWLEVKELFAKELLVGLARLDGRVIGILANQPMQKGGVLFSDSADKAARFIWLCDAFGIPLLFLADVPGFMIGTDVERRGIIRHGAKMITAVSEATVPKISVIVRKAYGAGLYAMAGPAFDSDATIALPSAQIAVMGPEPAVNAVFFNKLAELPEDQRAARRQELEDEYREDVDLYKLAANLIVDDVVEPERLREQLSLRFRAYASRWEPRLDRKHGVPPV
jgi:acetyl-CoA carboxylase carboxyltransferase component